MYSNQKASQIDLHAKRIRIFLKTEIFFPLFSNTYASTRSVFESLSSVHTKTLQNGNKIAPSQSMRNAGGT